MDSTTHSLRVPGASLYYTVQGSGPALLLINGGPTDATPGTRSMRSIASR